MTSAILHAHVAALADPQQPLSSKLTLKTTTTSVIEKEKMLKHIGKIVCKLFDGCRFHGRVMGVEYHEIYMPVGCIKLNIQMVIRRIIGETN